MSDEECRVALGSRHVGRAAVQTDSGPHIVPVHYAIAGDSLFFRASSASVLGQNACAGTVAFEIDELDPARRAGWSVLVRGPVARFGRELFELKWRELSGRRTEPDEAAERATDA